MQSNTIVWLFVVLKESMVLTPSKLLFATIKCLILSTKQVV